MPTASPPPSRKSPGPIRQRLARRSAAAIAENFSDSTTRAVIDDSKVTARTGAVLVLAESTSVLSTAPTAVALAASISIGIAAAGSGAVARNVSNASIRAAIRNDSDVTSSGDVTVRANDLSDVNAEVVSVAVSIGLIGLSVGIGIAENDVKNAVEAKVDDSKVTANNAGEIRIEAKATQDLLAKADVAAIAVAIGGAGAGAVSRTNLDSTVEAYARDAQLIAIGNKVFIDADSDLDARAESLGLAGSGGVAVSVVIADATIGGATRAWADGATTVTASAMDVTADSIADALPDGISISLALGGAGSGAIINGAVDRTTEAYVGDRAEARRDIVEIASNSIYVGATDFETGEIVTYATTGDAIDGLQNGGQYLVIADRDGAIRLAEFEVDSESGENVYQRDVFFRSQGTGSHSLFRSGGKPVFGFDPDASVVLTGGLNPAAEPTTITLTGGTLKIAADATNTATATPVSVAIAGGISVGVSLTDATIDARTLAYVGERATVTAGDLDIDAVSDEYAEASNVTVALAAGASVGVSVANALIDSETEAFTGTRAGQTPLRADGRTKNESPLTDTRTSSGLAVHQRRWAREKDRGRYPSGGKAAASGSPSTSSVPHCKETGSAIRPNVGKNTTLMRGQD